MARLPAFCCVFGLSALLFAPLLFCPQQASAAPAPKATELVSAGVEALRAGAVSNAIEHFERANDLGVIHPNLSYNRALAYLGRARSAQALPGDLGQAAAGLEEVLLQAPEDTETERVLGALRAEMAHRRAKSSGEPVAVRPSLGRAVVGVVPHGVGEWLAVAASCLLTLGLLVRAVFRRVDLRLAGGIALGVGAALLAITAPLSYAARWLRNNTEPAVVISREARLLNEQGMPESAPRRAASESAIPEGSLVFVHEKAGDLANVEWGSTSAWVSLGQLRTLRESSR